MGTLFILLVVKSFDQSVNEQRETTKIIHGFPPRKINDIHVNAHKVYKLCAKSGLNTVCNVDLLVIEFVAWPFNC